MAMKVHEDTGKLKIVSKDIQKANVNMKFANKELDEASRWHKTGVK